MRLGMLGLGLSIMLGATSAEAFCGFYVSGADAKLFNNATQVVLMREGTRTVLSMQNNYQGPPSSFAMVVPVPVVLQKENVKTLPKEVFTHIDQLSAPRLVEYWEQDPCEVHKSKGHLRDFSPMKKPSAMGAESKKEEDLGVRIEAKFTVGEYDVVVLSAKDSGGLDTWLRSENYKIPEGAEPYLKPYVQAGSKFFVAKVDTTKVQFEKGMAMLSPLRFHYDTETFSLPVRLGLMNSQGTQDLIVSVIAKNQRYEVANYPNTTIPTNFDVAEGARNQFGPFYAALFDRTLEKIPKAVVTEYSWATSSCDPCPTPPLSPSELNVLGQDVLTGPDQGDEERPRFRGNAGYVLTRLHARYAKDSLGEDLVFRAAGAITGGREVRLDKGQLENGAKSSSVNNFQARYAIRHPWTGAIACKDPQRGRWGGPPNGGKVPISPVRDIAFAPRKAPLTTLVKGALPEVVALPGAIQLLGSPVVPVPVVPDVVPAPVDAGATEPPPMLVDAGAPAPPPVPPDNRGCGCEVVGGRGNATLGAALAFVAAVVLARRKRS